MSNKNCAGDFHYCLFFMYVSPLEVKKSISNIELSLPLSLTGYLEKLVGLITKLLLLMQI